MKIAYRVGSILLALSVFPALFFLKFVRVFAEISLLDSFFNDEFSIKQIYETFGGLGNGGFSFPKISAEVLEFIAPLKAPAIICAVSLVLLMLTALAVIVCSWLKKPYKVNACLGAAGIVCAATSLISFGRISSLIVNGTVGVSGLINEILSASGNTIGAIAGLLSAGNLTDYVFDVKALQLSSAVIMQIVIFLAILLWSLSFYLVGIGEDK